MADDDARHAQHSGLETDTDDLYEHSPCAQLSTLPDGTIIRANQTFLDWLGYPREAVVGHTRFQTLLTVGGRIYYETHYAPLLQMQGFVHEIALDMRRADGRRCPVVASATQRRGANGVAVTRLALFDSTQRRQYERELLEARKRAEEAARELSEADRRKNEFLATVAHELRNPLAPLRNAVELVRRSEEARMTTNHTTLVMQRQVAQMVRLVDDLLDASRLGQDKLELRRVPVDLASVVRHAIEASEPLIQEAGLVLTTTIAGTPIYVEGDAARLIQVIGNILNNATKFTPREGHVFLALDRDGDEAVIRIRDTGVGIEAHALARVFDLFMQVDQSRERRTGGLGIGLTLAKTLVERHDGCITVDSAGLGTGSEFVIRLPALLESLQSVSRSFEPPHVPTSVPRRILVVDDNRDSAEMMGMLLELRGHQVQLAYDGPEAVKLREIFQPQVVLLDIGLPGLNGYQVAERIRSQSGPQPVLVALTGWGQDDDRRKSSEAGFDAHLVKPVDHDLLLKLIMDLPSPARASDA